jgi:hypothetical protein
VFSVKFSFREEMPFISEEMGINGEEIRITSEEMGITSEEIPQTSERMGINGEIIGKNGEEIIYFPIHEKSRASLPGSPSNIR